MRKKTGLETMMTTTGEVIGYDQSGKQYESLCSAIAAIENGAQSYNVDGQSVTKANLATLYSRQKALESQIRQAQGGNLCIVEFADRG
mgnify:CR=1 FL=1